MSDIVAAQDEIQIANALLGMKTNDFAVEVPALSSRAVPRWPKDCEKRTRNVSKEFSGRGRFRDGGTAPDCRPRASLITMASGSSTTGVEIIAADETLMLLRENPFAPQEEPAPPPHLSEELERNRR